METKHSLGPWAQDPGFFGRVTNGKPGFGGRLYRVADAYYSSAGLAHTPHRAEAEANARLIAAAPALLAALEAALREYEDTGCITPITQNAARAAILKARGE